jgi:hypothetical protein
MFAAGNAASSEFTKQDKCGSNQLNQPGYKVKQVKWQFCTKEERKSETKTVSMR